MADGIIGQQYTERFRTASASETFTISGATKPDGSAWSGPTITDLGSGSYRLSFTPDVEGVWEATLTGGTSGEVLVGEWDIAAYDTSVGGVASTPPTITRAELRSRVAAKLGDRLSLTATDDSDTTHFIDTLHLGSMLENPRHREMVFLSGSNAGEVRRITVSDLTTSTLTLNAALPVATATGDTAEVYNFRGKNLALEDYHTAINEAIDAAWPAVKVPFSVDVAADFDSQNPVLTIPATITHIDRVEYLDTNGDYQWIDPAVTPGGYGWEIDPYAGTITVRGSRYLYLADGLTVRLTGGAREAPLTTDSDTTQIDPQWLVLQATANIALQLYHRGEQEFYNTAIYLQQQADRIKPRSRGTMRAVRVL
jgi:hypothetical protein